MVPFVWFHGMRTAVKKGGEAIEQWSIVNRHFQRIALTEIRDYFRLNLGKWAISKNAG